MLALLGKLQPRVAAIRPNAYWQSAARKILTHRPRHLNPMRSMKRVEELMGVPEGSAWTCRCQSRPRRCWWRAAPPGRGWPCGTCTPAAAAAASPDSRSQTYRRTRPEQQRESARSQILKRQAASRRKGFRV